MSSFNCSLKPLAFNKLKSVFLLHCFLFSTSVYLSQSNATTGAETKTRVMIRQGIKLLNLNSYDEHAILQNISSNGQDSISTLIYSYSISYKKDTLLVVPEDVSRYRYMDTINAYTESFDYAKTTTITLKIPINQIESIKAKRQPLSKITGGITAVSYVALICSPFIAMSKNDAVADFGVGLFLVAVPTIAISWSINGFYAKKRFHFDRNKTHKDIWKFE